MGSCQTHCLNSKSSFEKSLSGIYLSQDNEAANQPKVFESKKSLLPKRPISTGQTQTQTMQTLTPRGNPNQPQSPASSRSYHIRLRSINYQIPHLEDPQSSTIGRRRQDRSNEKTPSESAKSSFLKDKSPGQGFRRIKNPEENLSVSLNRFKNIESVKKNHQLSNENMFLVR